MVKVILWVFEKKMKFKAKQEYPEPGSVLFSMTDKNLVNIPCGYEKLN